MRRAMYSDERAAMRAAARAIHLVEINSLLRFIASHDPEAPRIVGTHKVPAHIRHETIGRFDAPYRTASQNT